jgi:hypothetical protein
MNNRSPVLMTISTWEPAQFNPCEAKSPSAVGRTPFTIGLATFIIPVDLSPGTPADPAICFAEWDAPMHQHSVVLQLTGGEPWLRVR